MSQYHKIETAFERDEATHKVYPDRLKNPVYALLKRYVWTEKIDGTNIRVIWKPLNVEQRLEFRGKTDNAQLHADLVTWLIKNITAEKLEDVFPSTNVIIYGEGYGAGIQKGGAYSAEKKFIAFDVFVDEKWWLGDAAVRDVCQKLGIAVVPHLGETSLEEAVERVRIGFASPLAMAQTGEARPAEGLVGRPVETMFDKKGSRIIIKLKTEDF